MTRSKLVEKLATTYRHMHRDDVTRIVAIIFEQISDALARGERVELRGFGAFTVRHRPARGARNPRNGDRVALGERHVPFFRAGKLLQNRLNRQPE